MQGTSSDALQHGAVPMPVCFQIPQYSLHTYNDKRHRFRCHRMVVDPIANHLLEYGKKIYDSVKGEKNNKIILQNKALAKSLNLRGTPASVVNDTIIPGYVKLSNLRKMVTQ